MKYLLVTLLTLSSFSVFAEEENFDKAKTVMTEHLDRKIADLQTAKSCVTAAKTKEALKVCHEEMKAKHKAHREHMKDKRKHKKK